MSAAVCEALLIFNLFCKIKLVLTITIPFLPQSEHVVYVTNSSIVYGNNRCCSAKPRKPVGKFE
jgi:hypothetical protein